MKSKLLKWKTVLECKIPTSVDNSPGSCREFALNSVEGERENPLIYS